MTGKMVEEMTKDVQLEKFATDVLFTFLLCLQYRFHKIQNPNSCQTSSLQSQISIVVTNKLLQQCFAKSPPPPPPHCSVDIMKSILGQRQVKEIVGLPIELPLLMC